MQVQKNAKPPVCKIMDFHKEKYKQQLKEKDRAKSQVIISLRILKLLSPKLVLSAICFSLGAYYLVCKIVFMQSGVTLRKGDCKEVRFTGKTVSHFCSLTLYR